jgi:hypothetical protein
MSSKRNHGSVQRILLALAIASRSPSPMLCHNLSSESQFLTFAWNI